MYEVEVKVPGSLDMVRDRLESLDAVPEGAVDQVDVYYDHPDRSFAETDEALRIRREDEAAQLTYKGPKLDTATKTRREVETEIPDPEVVESILQALDFEPVAEIAKHRERYQFEGYAITLDRVDGVGEFIEVEATGSSEEIESLRAGAESVLAKLGLDPTDGIRTSYLELLLDVSE